jgi:hypothetical protein
VSDLIECTQEEISSGGVFAEPILLCKKAKSVLEKAFVGKISFDAFR